MRSIHSLACHREESFLAPILLLPDKSHLSLPSPGRHSQPWRLFPGQTQDREWEADNRISPFSSTGDLLSQFQSPLWGLTSLPITLLSGKTVRWQSAKKIARCSFSGMLALPQGPTGLPDSTGVHAFHSLWLDYFTTLKVIENW